MKTLRDLINIIDDESVDEGSMADAEHNPSGPKFGGYYGATQKGPPRPGQGAGGCEESVEHTDEQIEEDAADDVIALANEIKRD